MLHSARRPGQVSVVALILLPLMIGTLFLVVFLFRTRDSLIELRNAGVATSLAAAEDLVDDALLTGDPTRVHPRLARARQSADTLARQNIVEGRRLALRLPDADDEPGDVVFGAVDRVVGGRFERYDPRKAAVADFGQVNAVEVTVRQPNKPSVFTRVTAVLDQSVVGFKPWAEKPAPVVPVALYDVPDPADAMYPPWSQLLRAAKDEWKLERGGVSAFKPGADGLPEVKVRVGDRSAAADEVFGLPLILGTQSAAERVGQIRTGLTTDAVGRMGGFQLDADNVIVADGNPYLYRNVGAEKQADTAEVAFRALAVSGEPRVWPVFGTIDEHGRAVLSGFTAARVVAVESAGNGTLVLRLQPSVVASPTAVTDPTRTDRDGKPFGTRHVVKIRLAG